MTIHAKDDNAGFDVVIQVTCRRWGCVWCGPLKVKRLAAQNMQAKPNRLITLTVNPALYTDPVDAWRRTSSAVSRLADRLRRRLGEFEYCRVTESTKAGWPHYHLVTRCPFVPHQVIKVHWQQLTGATIVDVRKVRDTLDVARYVMKYLAKQTVIPWTNRRVSMTKGYVPAAFKDAAPRPRVLSYLKRYHLSPPSYALQSLVGWTLERLTTNVWKATPPDVDYFERT